MAVANILAPITDHLRGLSKAPGRPANGALLQGDCLDITSRLPAASFRGIVTSPPYNLRNSSGNGLHEGRGGKWEKAALLKGYSTHMDAMPHDAYVRWQLDCLDQMMCLLRLDGVIFCNHKWRLQKGLLKDSHDIVAGFPVRQIIIWHQSGGINFNAGYFLPNYKVIYMIAKSGFVLAQGANRLGCVWRISERINTPHPAPFPPELVQNCLAAIGDGPVLGPFFGSGTTDMVAT